MTEKIPSLRIKYGPLLRRGEAVDLLRELGGGERTLKELVRSGQPIRRFITRADKQHRYDRDALIAVVLAQT